MQKKIIIKEEKLPLIGTNRNGWITGRPTDD